MTLAYRHDYLRIPISLLTMRLLEHSPSVHHLPASLVRELAVYPDWSGRKYPGAQLSTGLIQMLTTP